ncbi:hypothetical protein Patl1_05975 [Pistacia atlantica]|uniref:Uncharacterized protein n=1 Tax=Pistacia atlantica TaxID=434234 RepID=A0ACC1BTE1_9ROSI|nr:hypothetical protein Patl1_05975 [Pistacia atlantica]
MSPAMSLVAETDRENELPESQYQKGVRHLCEKGIEKVPTKYILPLPERPNLSYKSANDININANSSSYNLNLPIIDFSQLQGSNRYHVLNSLAKACEEYGFFQLVNHGIPNQVISDMFHVAKRFFELPFEERSKHMSTDMRSPAVLESLGLLETRKGAESENGNCGLEEFEDGSQLIVMNCYPSCPEPELTLGMAPHSDYGFLTLLLQDQQVKGLQIQHGGNWIFSNGRYKSVLHRVLANSTPRISVASLHSLPFSSVIRPAPKLVNGANPSRYKATDFASFLDYISSCEPRQKNFLESRKVT